ATQPMRMRLPGARAGLTRTLLRRRTETDGQDLAARQADAHPQIQDPRLYSLQSLRAPPRGVPEVRALPHLPARARPQRPDPGDDEVLVVNPQQRCEIS